jgi:hypothetical protein
VADTPWVTTDRSVERYGRKGAHAWVSPTFTYPKGWVVSIRIGNFNWINLRVSSLDEALRVAAENGVELDVDDWTYAAMVADGAAPATRPERALRPEGEYPGTGPGDEDVRPLSLAVLQHAPDFIGLTEDAAYALARERKLGVEVLDEGDLVSLDLSPTRLRLRLKNGRVDSASVG